MKLFEGLEEKMRQQNIDAIEIELKEVLDRFCAHMLNSANPENQFAVYDKIKNIVDKTLIIRALDFYHWNQSKVARVLGISRGCLRMKMKIFGLLEL